MEMVYTVANMSQALVAQLHPAITRWNRLEGRPRTHNFDRALRAEVRDGLWMLTRQWQLGEFRGDDAGSPVLARACIDTAPIDRFQAGTAAEAAFSLAEPIETRVEARPIPLNADAQYLSLDLRMAVGRRWLKLLAREEAAGRLTADYRQDYINEYGVEAPDPMQPGDAGICAHLDVWAQASAAAGRVMDGVAFLDYLVDAAHNAFDDIGAAASDHAALTTLAQGLQRWFTALIRQPTDSTQDAWLPPRLEYRFGCATSTGGGNDALHAEEYYSGHLDWYALERSPGGQSLDQPPPVQKAPKRDVHTFVPASIVFEGMPATRWWALEDRRTNFGEVRADSVDLGKLLLMEFALVYANDWFVLPYTLPIGTVAQVRGIALTNVFGERLWIEPIRERPASDWQRWSMFTLTAPPTTKPAPAAQLVLLAAAPKIQESAPLEEIALVRDEMANMVWGVERRVPMPSGAARPGAEAGREFLEWLQRPLKEEVQRLTKRKADLEAIPVADRTPAEVAELADVVARLAAILPPDPKAPLRYRVMNSVPEHWIPFIPVHVDNSVREVQLQRAAMPRILEGAPIADPPQKVRPRTALLRQNLPGKYFIFEEEVPRAGALVSQSYQRTRWLDGKVLVWLGARKQTGRGEGASGLAFDQLAPTPPKT